MSHHRLPALLLSTAAFAALAIPAAGAGASATPRDRDHDRMPDRWERAHGLKVARNDARRDRDHDGLKNIAEYRAGLDPRDADTDDDGIGDDAENVGVVVSFTDGVLEIRTFDGEVLRGRVTARTEVNCDDDPPAALRSGGDDEEREDSGDHADDDSPRPVETDDHADDDAPRAGEPDDHGVDDDDPEEHEAGDCGAAALVAGARVDEATLSLTRGGRIWAQVELGR